MGKTLPLKEQSISQIYLEGQENIIYKIPIYQRNYAWEEDEITALIKDVYDSFCNRKPVYYIGTLVTYKREDNEYEVIDGQQRLTTIYIILKSLGIDEIRNKLTFTARKVSAETIKNLPNFKEDIDKGIEKGYKNAEKAIKNNIDTEKLKEFEHYLLYYVHIIHYCVPKDVDLNHYFEVMNSRGEQLEKHEIVKSIFSSHLNKTEQTTFSRIWEACSEMTCYIQQKLPDTIIFGNKLATFNIREFESIPEKNASDGKNAILNLLQEPIEKMGENDNLAQNDEFQPITDFPNFLLIVLKLTLFRNYNLETIDLTLDDKELLNEFAKALALKEIADKKNEFTKLFAFNLLKAKYLLDNYIVHHVVSTKEQSGDNPWKLQRYYQENKNKKYPKNLSDKDNNIQEEMVHILSMFEVSFTARQRKNYLFYCLLHLFDNMEIETYLDFLRDLADKYFYGVYLNNNCLNDRKQPKPNAFDSVILKDGEINLDIEDIDYKTEFNSVYKQGNSDISLFVFNYTDYRLWIKYAEELRGRKAKKESNIRKRFFEDLGCSDFELDVFKYFYFSRTRKSLEHYYSQSKAIKDGDVAGNAISESEINCFGNFAMIGAEANSSGSNWDPKAKLNRYIDGKTDPISVASLKFRIMMQMCQDNDRAILKGDLNRDKGMEWNTEDMQVHQEKMLNIIL
ncbi:MAG: DUF262 domain-containing protein [Prevotella sp.]|nr:DUF262 domain-containing protein [Prevotella sp.]